ncbi:hypothetical protein [Streptomyces yaizuensis]|uniref:Uncharacterized protein n=1 Tax=Streptomyces yaizuensis TaxID=2989713 RepID=A0ABQ5NX56_9ACTN|nr:hypothetical protein [Streptomyces sp. YSPA8]GLF94952.1 hypothetical protein SYYSPA8_11665 [Streptomyces sp. YSPA8]
MTGTDKLPELPIPGKAFVDRLITRTWLRNDIGHPAIAWLLVGRPVRESEPRYQREQSELHLRAMCQAMGLHDPEDPERPLDSTFIGSGPRLFVGGVVVEMDYGHPEYLLQVDQPGPAWRRHALRGGPIIVGIGLLPVPRGDSTVLMREYLRYSRANAKLKIGRIGVHGLGSVSRAGRRHQER